MAATSDDRVDLTELDVITRYSLAVRSATADRAELIAALRADLQWLEGGRRSPAKAAATRSTATKRAGRPAAAKKSTARKSTGSRTGTRRAR